MTEPTPTQRDIITGMDCVLLAVSVLALTALAGIIAAQAVATLRIYEGTTAFLATVTILTGLGFITSVAIRTALRRQDQMEERMTQRLAEIEARFAEQCEERVASAFVEKIASGGHLRSVPNR